MAQEAPSGALIALQIHRSRVVICGSIAGKWSAVVRESRPSQRRLNIQFVPAFVAQTRAHLVAMYLYIENCLQSAGGLTSASLLLPPFEVPSFRNPGRLGLESTEFAEKEIMSIGD